MLLTDQTRRRRAGHRSRAPGRKSHSPSSREKPTEGKQVESVSKRGARLSGPLVRLFLFQSALTTLLQKKCDVVRSNAKSSLKNHRAPFAPRAAWAPLAGRPQKWQKLHQNPPGLEVAGANPGEQSRGTASSADTQQLRDGSRALQRAGKRRPRLKQQHSSVTEP